ncbi:MAG TPA: hypothetical protein VGP12_05520, partial [Nitrosospira sp.]|nr:hypothetical protein [Nitrosospira sp.]
MMNSRRLRFTAVAFALLSALVNTRILGDSSARENRAESDLVIPISGTAHADLESIALSGRARISSVLITDPDFGSPPSVFLSVDLVNVTGVGQRTGAKYHVTGEDKVTRVLRHSDLVEIAFPIFPMGQNRTP